MTSLITALGLVLVIEGLVYALAPRRMQELMAGLAEAPPDLLRTGGLLAMGIGLVIVWLARSFLSAS